MGLSAESLEKTLFTLNINHYEPEITALTYPWMQKYADKIGAEFVQITKRKFPDMPVLYEKLQLLELSRGNDWSIYIDSDALIHPDAPDFTELIPMDTVMEHGRDLSNSRYAIDDYFRRDGRMIGSAGWFVVCSSWCRDLWHPLDVPLDAALANIHPTVRESLSGITPAHLIEDYTMSRNIARFGLKFTTLAEALAPFAEKMPRLYGVEFLYHDYTITRQQKIDGIKNRLLEWELI